VVKLFVLILNTPSRVEIDAKIASGYFTSGTVMTETELSTVKGRDWEDIEH
jgi:hypothetical protein